MIFVTLGTQKFQFTRLLKMIDTLIEKKEITDKVIAQTGHTKYKSDNFITFDFLPKEEFDEYILQCDLLITHSGVGTILAGNTLQKPVIVIPRIQKYGEHVDDHQVQIANAFAENNFVFLAMDTKQLSEKLNQIGSHTFKRYISQQEDLVQEIDKYLDNI